MQLTMLTLHPSSGAILKRSTALSHAIPIQETVTLREPVQLSFWQVSDAGHLKVGLLNPIQGFYNWYIFGAHCTIRDENRQVYPPVETRLKVPFWHQLDNRYEPHRTCNSSACAMAAKYLNAPINSDDEYYQIVRKYGDTTDHSAQTKALTEIGIKSFWCTDLDFDDLDKSLSKNKPIVIGILHRGSLLAPTGGHMVVVIGKNQAGNYIVNDPYGSINDGYLGNVENGSGAVYTRKMLERRWTADGKNTGWGRLF